MRVAPEIILTDDERAELVKLERSKVSSVRLAQRMRIVLLAADGMQNKDIAQQLDVGRVSLEPGESRIMEFSVPVDMLGLTGAEGVRVVEPGRVELQVGVSSADIRLRGTVDVAGEKRSLGKNWRMFSRFKLTT